jgi:LacI family transcriptional regulator
LSDQAVPSATLGDVAKLAGVSLATASRSLNGSTRQVREDLRRRVLLAAAELNYSANAQAQAMARGRTNVVGLLVHDIADPFFSSIAAGAMRAAEEHGLVVTMASTLRVPEREIEYVAALRGQRARAVVLAGSRVDNPALLRRLGEELAAFEATGGRAALISQKRLPVDTVLLDNRGGAKSLAEQLVGLGHRRFAVLAGPRDLLTSRERFTGFQAGLTAAGIELDPEDVVHESFTRDGGFAAVSELLSRGTRATCVFAVNDVMAVGAMAALRERGVPVPAGMAVAGFDDILTLRDITPGLTTVRLPLEEVGAAAIDLVLKERGDRPRTRRITADVVLRDSTPAANPAR